MLHPSTKKLIDKLAEMTAQNKIAWTEGDDGAAVYDTEGYRVTLPGGGAEVILSDALGKELERASLDDLSAISDEAGRSYVDIVGDMKREAARIARGTEAAIDRVLAGLAGAPETTAPAFGDSAEPESGPEDLVDETAALEAAPLSDIDAAPAEAPAEAAAPVETNAEPPINVELETPQADDAPAAPMDAVSADSVEAATTVQEEPATPAPSQAEFVEPPAAADVATAVEEIADQVEPGPVEDAETPVSLEPEIAPAAQEAMITPPPATDETAEAAEPAPAPDIPVAVDPAPIEAVTDPVEPPPAVETPPQAVEPPMGAPAPVETVETVAEAANDVAEDPDVVEFTAPAAVETEAPAKPDVIVDADVEEGEPDAEEKIDPKRANRFNPWM
ncbi:MAG: hypothetical protein AAFX03_05460 [Pseudomonadota bacterium]